VYRDRMLSVHIRLRASLWPASRCGVPGLTVT
jgi:hypothetical protein